ncbi:MAG: hypothetical protein JXA18_12250 [Chitinispirillaceae bacterium]|nr:hypothetical protein [Chitinispirillaceae bacterium]
MGSMHCRLYDENLVHNIIMSAGMAVVDFLNENRNADADDVCEYLEMHADSIIEETIVQLNDNEEYTEKDRDDDSCSLPSDEGD